MPPVSAALSSGHRRESPPHPGSSLWPLARSEWKHREPAFFPTAEAEQSFTGTQPCSLIYVLPVTTAVWPAKPKVFIIWTLKNSCRLVLSMLVADCYTAQDPHGPVSWPRLVPSLLLQSSARDCFSGWAVGPHAARSPLMKGLLGTAFHRARRGSGLPRRKDQR